MYPSQQSLSGNSDGFAAFNKVDVFAPFDDDDDDGSDSGAAFGTKPANFSSPQRKSKALSAADMFFGAAPTGRSMGDEDEEVGWTTEFDSDSSSSSDDSDKKRNMMSGSKLITDFQSSKISGEESDWFSEVESDFEGSISNEGKERKKKERKARKDKKKPKSRVKDRERSEDKEKKRSKKDKKKSKKEKREKSDSKKKKKKKRSQKSVSSNSTKDSEVALKRIETDTENQEVTGVFSSSDPFDASPIILQSSSRREKRSIDENSKCSATVSSDLSRPDSIGSEPIPAKPVEFDPFANEAGSPRNPQSYFPVDSEADASPSAQSAESMKKQILDQSRKGPLRLRVSVRSSKDSADQSSKRRLKVPVDSKQIESLRSGLSPKPPKHSVDGSSLRSERKSPMKSNSFSRSPIQSSKSLREERTPSSAHRRDEDSFEKLPVKTTKSFGEERPFSRKPLTRKPSTDEPSGVSPKTRAIRSGGLLASTGFNPNNVEQMFSRSSRNMMGSSRNLMSSSRNMMGSSSIMGSSKDLLGDRQNSPGGRDVLHREDLRSRADGDLSGALAGVIRSGTDGGKSRGSFAIRNPSGLAAPLLTDDDDDDLRNTFSRKKTIKTMMSNMGSSKRDINSSDDGRVRESGLKAYGLRG